MNQKTTNAKLKNSLTKISLILSTVLLGITSLGHGKSIDKKQTASDHINNTLILNQGANQQVIAKNQDLLNGNKAFESKLTTPGITITENIHQQTDGRHIQENKIVVNIALSHAQFAFAFAFSNFVPHCAGLNCSNVK